MNHKNITQRFYINVFASALILILFGLAAQAVSAAPGEDYFMSEGDKFTAWLNGQTDDAMVVCDAYESIFSTDVCVSGSDTSDQTVTNLAAIGALLTGSGDDVETGGVVDAPSVTLLDKRCVSEDGAVDFALTEVTAHKLTRDGVTYDLADGLNDVDFQTFSDLQDGSYKLTVYNTVGSNATTFDVACDPEDEDGGDDTSSSITASCDVSPDNPEIDQTVVWEAQGESESGTVSYSWSGDVYGTTDQVTTSYSSSGEKEGFATITSGEEEKTVRCSVTVQGENNIQSVNQAAVGRTIENF